MTVVSNKDYGKIYEALEKGGEIRFEEGVYNDLHLKITKPVHLIGNGALLAGGTPVKWKREGELLVCDTKKGRTIKAFNVNGTLRRLCRYPESGYINHDTVFDVRWLSTSEGGWARKPAKEELTRVRFENGQLDGLDVSNAEITVVHSWSESTSDVLKFENNTVYLSDDAYYPPGGFGIRECYFKNVPQALKSKGTYYHDAKAGKLYYMPLDGEDESTPAYVPSDGAIIEISCGDVEIEGFELTASEGGGIYADGFYSLKLHDLDIHGVGARGISLENPPESSRTQITNVSVRSAGATGIYANLSGGENTLEHCFVSDIGISPGRERMVYGIEALRTDIRYCEVRNTPYTGIRYSGESITVEKNRLCNVMRELDDGAAIYSFAAKNCVVKNNRVWDIQLDKTKSNRMAYYFDEQSENCVLSNNFAKNCVVMLNIHMSKNIAVKNNVFVNYVDDTKITLARSFDISLTDNILMSQGVFRIRMCEGGVKKCSGNAIYAKGGSLTADIISYDYEPIETKPYAPPQNSSCGLEEYFADAGSFSAAGLEIVID